MEKRVLKARSALRDPSVSPVSRAIPDHKGRKAPKGRLGLRGRLVSQVRRGTLEPRDLQDLKGLKGLRDLPDCRARLDSGVSLDHRGL